MSADMAIRLAKAFGSTTETWIRLQAAYDVAQAQAHEDEIEVERYEPQPVFGRSNDVVPCRMGFNRSFDEAYDDLLYVCEMFVKGHQFGAVLHG